MTSPNMGSTPTATGAKPDRSSSANMRSLPGGLETLDVAYCRQWRFVPSPTSAGEMVIVSDCAPDPQVLDDLRCLLGAEPAVALCAEHELDEALEAFSRQRSETAEQFIAALEPTDGEPAADGSTADLLAQAHEAPVIRLVNLLLVEALAARASDVHLESAPNGLEVRYRVDGALRDAASPPGSLAPAVVGRLKVMADLDVAERRRPQDGRG